MKKIMILGVLAVLVLASFGASAYLPAPSETSQFTRLFQKVPGTWEVVPGGAYGYFSIKGITLKPVRNVNPPAVDDVPINQPGTMTWMLSVRAYGLKPLTEYAVVNYHEHFPWADTLATFTTDCNGYGYVFGETEGLVSHKVWVVPTSDFDVTQEKFFDGVWNPTEYLFEETVFD